MENKDIQLWKGDCLELMKDIPDKSVDMICADLPYSVLNKGNKHAKWDKMLPLDKLWEQYNRIIKDKGAIILFGQGMFTAQLMTSNPKMWRYNLIWDKVNRPTGFLDANRRPLRIHEDILVFSNGQTIYNPQFNRGLINHKRGSAVNAEGNNGKNGCYGKFKHTETVITNKKFPTSIVRITKEHKNFLHSTQKPVALIEWLIRTYSNEHNLILDNTAGSMTTAIAAINTDRKCICIEKDDHYFQIGSERVKKHLEEKNNRLF